MYLEPYTLTKLDVAALRKGEHLIVTIRDCGENGYVEAIKENRPTEGDPFAQDAKHRIAAPVTFQHDYRRDTTRATAFAMLWLYPSQRCHASSVLAQLRVGDGVRFVFWADAHTNGYMQDAGLHGDLLRLHQYRGGKEIATWDLLVGCTSDNSARMCRNVRAKTTEEMA